MSMRGVKVDRRRAVAVSMRVALRLFLSLSLHVFTICENVVVGI